MLLSVLLQIITLFISLQLICLQGTAAIGGNWFPDDTSTTMHNFSDAHTTRGDFPYLASLRIGGNHYCGAVIIRKNLLLTAAHCVAEQDKSRMKIIAGEYHLYNVDRNEQHLNVKDIMIHPLYSDCVTPPSHDIAAILVEGMKFVPNIVKKIRLANDDIGRFTGKWGLAGGWGITRIDENDGTTTLRSSLLRHNVRIISNEECNLFGRSYIRETHFCTNSVRRRIARWQGISGCPIVLRNYLYDENDDESYDWTDEAAKDLLLGIISFGGSLGQFSTLSTDVSKYSKWISCAELMTKDQHSRNLTSMFNIVGECNCTGFVCNNFKCLKKHTERCDGVDNCQDGIRSDELHCENCSNGAFRCGDGTCVKAKRICDCVPGHSRGLLTVEATKTRFSGPNPIAAQNLSNYIAGGAQTTHGDFPYMASLRIGGNHYCGAVIIRRNLLLTAAHCVAKQNMSRIKIIAGEYHLHNFEWNEQHLNVKDIMIHPLYNDTGTAQPHDIAAILVQGMELVPNIVEGIECAYDDVRNLVGNVGLASGWGITNHEGPNSRRPSPVLLQANLTIISNEECRNLVDSSIIRETHFCAGSLRENISTCRGDSGGPIVLTNYFHEGDCWNFLIGIISFGGPCGQFLTVSTDIRKYSKWISCSELMTEDENNHAQKLTSMFNKLGECDCTGFVCNNFKCLGNQTERCDGVDHCQDGARSDELRCENCSSGAFRCGDGTCIEGAKRCDCQPDCLDGTDELGCEETLPNMFRCENGKCIDNGLKCGMTDDESDEQDFDIVNKTQLFRNFDFRGKSIEMIIGNICQNVPRGWNRKTSSLKSWGCIVIYWEPGCTGLSKKLDGTIEIARLSRWVENTRTFELKSWDKQIQSVASCQDYV